MGRREGRPGLKQGAATERYDCKLSKGKASTSDSADVEGTSTPDAKDTPSKAFSNNSDDEAVELRNSRSMGIRRGGGSGKTYSSGAFGPVQAVPPMCYGLGSGPRQQLYQQPSHQQMPNGQLLGVSKQHQQQAAAFGAGFAPHNTGSLQSSDRQQQISSVSGHQRQQAAGHLAQQQKQQPAPPSASAGNTTNNIIQSGKSQQRSTSGSTERACTQAQDDLTRSGSGSSDGSQRHNSSNSRSSRQLHLDQSPAAFRRSLSGASGSPPIPAGGSSSSSSGGPRDAPYSGTGSRSQHQHGLISGKLTQQQQQQHGRMGELRDQNPRGGWSGPGGVTCSAGGRGEQQQQQPSQPQPQRKLPFSKGGPPPLGAPDGIAPMGNRGPPGRHSSNASLGRGPSSNNGSNSGNSSSSGSVHNAARPKPLVLPGEDDLLSDLVPPRGKQTPPPPQPPQPAPSSLQAQQQQQLLHHQQVLRAAGAHISSSPTAVGGNNGSSTRQAGTGAGTAVSGSSVGGSTGTKAGQNTAAAKSQQGSGNTMGWSVAGQQQGGNAAPSGAAPAALSAAGASNTPIVSGAAGVSWTTPAPPPPPPPPPRKQPNVVMLPSQDIRKAPGTLVPLTGISRGSSYSALSSSDTAPVAPAPAQRSNAAGPPPPAAGIARALNMQGGQQQGGIQHYQQGQPVSVHNGSAGRPIAAPMPPPGVPQPGRSAGSSGSTAALQMRSGQQVGSSVPVHPLSPVAAVHGVGSVEGNVPGGNIMGPPPPMHPPPPGNRGASGSSSSSSMQGSSNGGFTAQQQCQQQQQCHGSAAPANSGRAGPAAGTGNRQQGNRQQQQQQGNSSVSPAGGHAAPNVSARSWTKAGSNTAGPAAAMPTVTDSMVLSPASRVPAAPAVPTPATLNRGTNSTGHNSRDGGASMSGRGGSAVQRQQQQGGKPLNRDASAAAPTATKPAPVPAASTKPEPSAKVTTPPVPAPKPPVAVPGVSAPAAAMEEPRLEPKPEPPGPSKASPVVIASCLPEDEDDLLGITPSSSSSAKSAQQKQQANSSSTDAPCNGGYQQQLQQPGPYQHGVMCIAQPPPPPRKGGSSSMRGSEPAGVEATAAGAAAATVRGNRPGSSSSDALSTSSGKPTGLVTGRVPPSGSPYGGMGTPANVLTLSPGSMGPAVTWASHYSAQGSSHLGLQVGGTVSIRQPPPHGSPIAAASSILHSPQLHQHQMSAAQQVYPASALVKPPPSKRLEIVDPRRKSRSQLSDAGDCDVACKDEGGVVGGQQPGSVDSCASLGSHGDASSAITVGLLSV